MRGHSPFIHTLVRLQSRQPRLLVLRQPALSKRNGSAWQPVERATNATGGQSVVPGRTQGARARRSEPVEMMQAGERISKRTYRFLRAILRSISASARSACSFMARNLAASTSLRSLPIEATTTSKNQEGNSKNGT